MKLGKQGKINQKANRELKAMFIEKGITWCERCGKGFALSFAHRHKRKWYLGYPELLSSFNQVLLLCIPCHDEIEDNKAKTEELFLELRGIETNGHK